MTTKPVMFVSLLLTSACALDDSGSSNAVEAPPDGVEQRLELHQLSVVCGGAHPASQCQFANIGDAALMNDTLLIVSEPFREVVALDVRGNRDPRAVGRIGEGPGEYRGVQAIGAINGELRLFDIVQQRAIAFDADLNALSTVSVTSVPIGEGRVGGGGIAFLRVPGAEEIGSAVEASIVRWDWVSHEVSTIGTLITRATVQLGSDLQPILPFFSASPVWDTDDQGRVVFASGQDESVQIFPGDGGTLIQVRLNRLRRRRVVQADRDSLRERLLARPRSGVFVQQVNSAYRNSSENFPAITDVVALHDGIFLVREFQWVTGNTKWFALTDLGEYLGEFEVDQNTRFLDGDRHMLIAKSEDQLGALIISTYSWGPREH